MGGACRYSAGLGPERVADGAQTRRTEAAHDQNRLSVPAGETWYFPTPKKSLPQIMVCE
jgi:hypothetical protein